MQSYSSSSSDISTPELIKEQFPDERYPYFISPKMLLASTNPFLLMVLESKPEKFIFANPPKMTDKFPKRLTAINNELKRLMHINGELYNKKANDQAYSDGEIEELLKEKLGVEQAINVIKHYNQEQIYLLSQTTRIYYKDVWNNLSVLGVHNIPDNYYENIFSSDDLAIREVLSTHININVPGEVAGAHENWKFKIDLKIVSVITQAGFEMIGAGTNSALMANMLLNKRNPSKQLEKMVHAVSQVEKSAKKAAEDCQNEIIALMPNEEMSESDKSAAKNILESKLTPLNLLTQKIQAFKAGDIEFDELVVSISGLVDMAKTIPHSGIAYHNSLMVFGSPLKLNSPFVIWMINLLDTLREVKDALHTNLKPASKQAMALDGKAKLQLEDTEMIDLRAVSQITIADGKENDPDILRSVSAPAFNK